MRKVKAVITVVIAERKFQNMESENNEERKIHGGKGVQQEQGEYC
jgi:flagellar basal body L-ring protein FlgH